MQSLLVILLMLALFAPAEAQTVRPAPGAPTATTRPLAAAPARPITAPPLSTSGLQPLGSQPVLRGLPAAGTFYGLRNVADPRPQCRVQCAQDRYSCASSDDDSCGERWKQCVNTCGRTAAR